MNKKIICILFLLTILPCINLPHHCNVPNAYAESDKKVRTVIETDLVGQLNPDGVMVSVNGFRRWIRETDKDTGVPSSYLQTGLGLATTPAYGRASVHAERLAAVFAKLRLQYDLYRYYGTNFGLLSFPSATSPFGEAEVDALEGKEEAANASRFLVRPTLYAKAGSVIFVNQTDFAYFRFTGKGPYFLDWTYETLLQDKDRVIENRTNVLFQIMKAPGDRTLLAGPYYEITRSDAANLTRQRAGIMAYWVTRDVVGKLKRPRIYAQIARYIEDRNREGEYVGTFGIGFDLDM